MISYCNCGMHVKSERFDSFNKKIRKRKTAKGIPWPEWVCKARTYFHYGSYVGAFKKYVNGTVPF